ncbi:hypothetical protein FHS14_006175 [Paenibacillus baekrokdamisoli]|nr:hypothetical protein [Paenibacillus baekrokdamisoli]
MSKQSSRDGEEVKNEGFDIFDGALLYLTLSEHQTGLNSIFARLSKNLRHELD